MEGLSPISSQHQAKRFTCCYLINNLTGIWWHPLYLRTTSPPLRCGGSCLPFSWQPSYKSFGITLFSFASSLAVLTSSLLVKESGCNNFSWHFALLSLSEGTLDLSSCRTPAEEECCTASVCPFPEGPKVFAGCTGRGHIRCAGNATMLSYAQCPEGWSEANSSKISLHMSATPY